MYKNLRKQLICLGLMTTLITSGAGVRTVSAVEEPGDMMIVKSVNTQTIHAGLSISNAGKASITTSVVGEIGTSKIELTAKLQKYNTSKKSWTTIKSWAKTVQATRGSNNPTYQLTSKGTYRSHITAVVWKDGKSEKLARKRYTKNFKKVCQVYCGLFVIVNRGER